MTKLTTEWLNLINKEYRIIEIKNYTKLEIINFNLFDSGKCIHIKKLLIDLIVFYLKINIKNA